MSAKRHRSGPRSIAASVRAVREQVMPPTPLAAVQAAWEDAVGEAVAARARPVAERDGTVTVACDAATWAQELDLLAPEIAARLRESLGDEAPARFRFVVGDGRWADPT